jgi:hypothetical protein
MTSRSDDPEELLFSYGPLQDPTLQQSVFGRQLAGEDDQLYGYTLTMLEPTDARPRRQPGRHPIMMMTGQPEDRVDGTLYHVSQKELQQADTIEATDYKRDRVKLASGKIAWAYIDAKPPSYEPDGSSY